MKGERSVANGYIAAAESSIVLHVQRARFNERATRIAIGRLQCQCSFAGFGEPPLAISNLVCEGDGIDVHIERRPFGAEIYGSSRYILHVIGPKEAAAVNIDHVPTPRLAKEANLEVPPFIETGPVNVLVPMRA